jgi:hypothetical protein
MSSPIDYANWATAALLALALLFLLSVHVLHLWTP